MDAVLWVLQVILGIKLLTVTFTHGPGQSKATVQDAIQKLGKPARPILYIAALGTFIGTGGLILPGLLDLPSWLTPLSAVVCGFFLLVSIFFHLQAREKPKIFVSIVLFLFAAAIAYGRWVLVPF